MDTRPIPPLLASAQAALQAGATNDAEAHCRRILQSDPENPEALHILGFIALQRGQPDVALQLLEEATKLTPDNAEFLYDLGTALAMLGQHETALERFANAIAIGPPNAAIHCDAGMSLMALERTDEAIDQLRTAAQLGPDDPRILMNFGLALRHVGADADAEPVFARAAQVIPEHPMPWIQLADVLWSLGKFDDALPVAQEAVTLGGDDPAARIVLGNALQMAGQLEEAADQFRRAAAIAPDRFDAQNNLALTLLKCGEARASLEIYDQMLARWPASDDARSNRSLALLALGEIERGFAEYESRWATAPFARFIDPRRERWDGSDPAGRTIVITNEQGVGDLIQFIRYAPMLADRGSKVWVSCGAELQALVSTVRGVSGVVDPLDAAIDGELTVSVSSLPALFKTTANTIPAAVPYLSADTDRIQSWRKELEANATFKVGLVWAGAASNDNDRARSSPLANFAPLAAVTGVAWYALQKGPAAAQSADPPAGMTLIPLGEKLRDFADTAAVMGCLDLIISVDTSSAHLAGALARPAWTLLYKGADWRWLQDRADSPWYPTMRLFRQQKLGQWAPVLTRVAEELQALVKEKK